MGRCAAILLLLAALLPAQEDALQQAREAVERGEHARARRLLLLELGRDLDAERRRSVEALLAELDGSTPLARPALGALRDRVAAMLAVAAPDAAQWQAFEDLRRQQPTDPLVQRVLARFRPRWAEASGSDDHGRWASWQVGRLLVRFRLVPAGELQLPTGRVLRCPGDLWFAETEATSALVGSLVGSGHAVTGEQHAAAGLGPEGVAGLVLLLAGRLPDGVTVRLPTPEEWEYAARAGATGARQPGIDRVADALVEALAPGPVAAHPANAWGLRDVHGSVWEMVRDRHGEYWRCGGGWRSRLEDCAFGAAQPLPQWRGDPSTGFRLVIAEAAP